MIYWRNSRPNCCIIKNLYLTWELSPGTINIFFSVFRKYVSFMHFPNNIQVVYDTYHLPWFGPSRDNRNTTNSQIIWDHLMGGRTIFQLKLIFSLFLPFFCKYLIGTLYNNYIAWFELHNILLFSLIIVWRCYLQFGMGLEVSKYGCRSQ